MTRGYIILNATALTHDTLAVHPAVGSSPHVGEFIIVTALMQNVCAYFFHNLEVEV